ncbi:hypothetical protein DPEC_G00251870 [Dallia pectoralis]|uniref:Uncharacterized protein n=1 Tax=Dallia pectoralis TaxID=75939 RepID=A0ACC2FTE6_DALPE|nr:hypothetical protein DPEC_G00251870 [Dallia pectoralis]
MIHLRVRSEKGERRRNRRRLYCCSPITLILWLIPSIPTKPLSKRLFLPHSEATDDRLPVWLRRTDDPGVVRVGPATEFVRRKKTLNHMSCRAGERAESERERLVIYVSDREYWSFHVAPTQTQSDFNIHQRATNYNL